MAEVIKNIKTFDSSNSTFTTYPVGADAENVALSETTQAALSDRGIEVSDVDNAIVNLANTNSVDDNFLFVTFTGDNTNGYECDYTLSEIWDAYRAGKKIFAWYNTGLFTQIFCGSFFVFAAITGYSSQEYVSIRCIQYSSSQGITSMTFTLYTPSANITYTGKMTLDGTITVSEDGKITGIPEPVDDADAVPKSYVDNTIDSAITSVIGDVIAASY